MESGPCSRLVSLEGDKCHLFGSDADSMHGNVKVNTARFHDDAVRIDEIHLLAAVMLPLDQRTKVAATDGLRRQYVLQQARCNVVVKVVAVNVVDLVEPTAASRSAGAA